MTTARVSTAPRTHRRDATRPPIATRSAGCPSAVDTPPQVRRTAQPRTLVRPAAWIEDAPLDFAATDPYVRTFWTAFLGPSAIADYLRLVRAAEKKGTIKRPRSLDRLARNQLVRLGDQGLEVRTSIPPLSVTQVMRLPPRVRRRHADWRIANPR
jgi:hypothetical protein